MSDLFASNSVFNFKFFTPNDKEIIVDTCKSHKFTANLEGKYFELTIEDALVDIDLFNDIGELANEIFRVEGSGVFRNMDGEDVNVLLSISVAKLASYKINFACGEITAPKLIFELPFDDCYGFKNISLKAVDKC